MAGTKTNFWGRMLRAFGWSVDITAPYRRKCIICVAPHTSNYDFIIGLAAYRSLGRKACFLMKEFWFFFPLKYILKALGGIPVPNERGSALSAQIIGRFKNADSLNLAVTPEGTRSYRTRWRTGFLYIAYGAHVPLQLGVIDYRHRKVIIHDEYTPTGDVEADMLNICRYYDAFKEAARYPEKFASSHDKETTN